METIASHGGRETRNAAPSGWILWAFGRWRVLPTRLATRKDAPKKRVWNGYTLLLNLLSSHQSKFPQNRRNQRLISTMDWSKVVVVAEWTPFQPMKTSIDHIITFHLLIASNTLPDLIHQSTFLQYQQYYNTKHPEYIHDISWSVGGFKPHGPMNVLVIAPLSLSTLAGDPRVIRIKEPD